jgi:iron complex outermembrane receptor protein
VLPSRNHIKQWGVSANLNWDISDTLNFISITAYREYDTWSTWDEDGSPFAIRMLDNRLDNYQLTQEFRLNGETSAVDWTVGAFYLDQESHYEARVDLNDALLDFIHGPDPTPADTWAVFGHAVWHVTDRFNLIGGLRYSDEHKGYTHFRHNPDGSDVGSLGPTFPGAPDLINIRLTGVNGLEANFDDTRTDYRVAADYAVADNMMVYTSISTGYKSGGVNPRPFFPIQLQTFQPETLTAYEVGWKSTLLDNTLRFNAAAFYTEYEDIQLVLTQCEVPLFVSPTGFGPPCLKPNNVGNADIKGIELEANWLVSENLLIDAMYSWLDFEYTSVDAFALQGSPIAPLDMITPYTPEDKWNLGVQYQFPWTDLGSFTIRADAYYQSDTYADATNSPLNLIEAYTLVNLVTWWDAPDEGWRIEFTVMNLFDEVYYLDLYDQANAFGAVLAQPGLPRTYGIAFQRNF